MGWPAGAMLRWSEKEALLSEVFARATTFTPDHVNRTVVEQLGIELDDAVLELGFGSGRTLAAVSARTPRGFVAGVDPSERMLRHARMRVRRSLESGRVELHLGCSSDLSMFADGRFDKAFGVHLVYFWDDPHQDLREIRRVLRPGGRLLLGFCSSEEPTGGGKDPARFSVARLEALLGESGFAGVRTELRVEGERSIAWTLASG